MLLETLPLVAIGGNMDVGKSTLINASLGGLFSPDSPLHLTRFISEIKESKEKSGRCFRMIFADGEETDIEIQSLWDTMEGQQKDIERLILYAEPSVLLNRMRLMDLPGMKMESDATVINFVRETDVLVYVVSETDSVRLFEVTDTATTLPGETVIVVNKIDKGIDWQDPALCLEKVAKSTEDRAREDIQKQADNTEVVAVSALVALASEIWDDHIFQGVLKLAEPGDFAIMEKTTYFGEERADLPSVSYRNAILEKANSCLEGPWPSPTFCKPAWPALMFAIGFAIHQEVKCPKSLRDSLRKFSGIDRLKEVLLSVSQSDRITARQEAEGAVSAAESEILRLQKSLAEVRRLLEGTDKMATQVNGGFGHTEERRYFHTLKTHLETREVELAVGLRERQQWLSDMGRRIN